MCFQIALSRLLIKTRTVHALILFVVIREVIFGLKVFFKSQTLKWSILCYMQNAEDHCSETLKGQIKITLGEWG